MAAVRVTLETSSCYTRNRDSWKCPIGAGIHGSVPKGNRIDGTKYVENVICVTHIRRRPGFNVHRSGGATLAALRFDLRAALRCKCLCPIFIVFLILTLGIQGRDDREIRRKRCIITSDLLALLRRLAHLNSTYKFS